MATYAIIMAGGASSRFWPRSGDEFPKYLLKPDGANSLLQLAFKRAMDCCAASNVLIVTGGAQADIIRIELPDLSPDNLIIEPSRRDTAAAIALGCKEIHRRDPQANVVVLPADTLLTPPEVFSRAVESATALDDFSSFIHVFGAKPTRAEGGFGYIEPGNPVADLVFEVDSFKEKPGAEIARQYVDNGYLWNIGSFLFSLPHFLDELGQHLPNHSARLKPTNAEPAEYNEVESISVDFGIIERTSGLRVIKLDADFDDVGNWDALLQHQPRFSEAVSVDGDNNVVLADDMKVAVVGESNLLVVKHGDRLLIMKKGHGQHVKQAEREMRD
ncbi:MAG: mannose-1-phosphate guanylyltransferase, partial [Planctomycetota bacterium]